MTVGVAIGLFAGVEDAHDRGVRHLRGGLRLEAEARAERGVVRERRLQELDRDLRPRRESMPPYTSAMPPRPMSSPTR